jgi:phospholipid/cholesterol/gamma-HCH transport system permease protein
MLALSGELRMPDASRIWQEMRSIADKAKGPTLDIDLGGVEVLDGAVLSLLIELRDELAERGIRSEIVRASDRVQPLVHLYRADEPPHVAVPHAREDLVSRLGRVVRRAVASLKKTVAFLGDIVGAAFGAVRHPRSVDWRSVPALVERAGPDGVLIVLLLNFLVGFVMAFQSARQLQNYGANIFVADVVGISVTRELAPLMTAIIMSGRSGAAFAAELGTMRVSEEIDALRTMGFAPAPFLILPRMVALALVAPVLTLLGDVVGVTGGAVVAASSLDVSPWGYLNELRTAIFPNDIWSGLVKSLAFGLVIAFIGCQQGFATRGAAAGVGRGTTATVVICLFTIVIVDTIFTVLFRMFGE